MEAVGSRRLILAMTTTVIRPHITTEDNPPRAYLDPSAAEYPPYYGREFLVLGYDSGQGIAVEDHFPELAG